VPVPAEQQPEADVSDPRDGREAEPRRTLVVDLASSTPHLLGVLGILCPGVRHC
jgi:hypothetical protein